MQLISNEQMWYFFKILFFIMIICIGLMLIKRLIYFTVETISFIIRRNIVDPINDYFIERKEIKIEKKLSNSNFEEIDQMEGRDFERYLRYLFRDLGYQTTRTPVTGDFGADLILLKDGFKIAVQAKRYKKPVGIKAVQEVHSSLLKYDCDKAIAITNSTFTKAAKDLAEHTKVELWDREKLEEVINSVKKSKG